MHLWAHDPQSAQDGSTSNEKCTAGQRMGDDFQYVQWFYTLCNNIFLFVLFVFVLNKKKLFFFTLLPRFFQHIMARHRYFRAFCLFVFPSFYLSNFVFDYLCWPTLILDHLRQFSKFSLAVESAIFYLYQITSDSIARLNFDNCVRIYERYTAKGDFFSSK